MDQPQDRVVPEEWLRWYWLWDLYFSLGLVAISLILFEEDDATAGDHAVALGVVAAMAVWYVTYGRPYIASARPPSARGRIYMAVIVVLLVVGIIAQSAMAYALFAVCPMAFMSLRLREAIFVVVPANLLPILDSYLEDGWSAMVNQAIPGSLFTLTFAVLLGVWITRIVAQSEERRELIEELERSREEVSRLSREAGVNGERARIAAEIHDTLAQGFTSLVTLVQAAESELDRDVEKARGHLTLAARTARENLTEARALVAGLMPSELGGTGSLDQAVRRQLARLAEETGIDGTYRVEGESVELPTVLEVVLLRAVQESLTNVRRHAKATAVTITLRVTESCAALRVADNGTGFDVTAATDGFGLRGMRTRAAQVGGALKVHSGVNGTTVELEVPK